MLYEKNGGIPIFFQHNTSNGIMPCRCGHIDTVNIDANQMDASKIEATMY